MMMIDYRRNIFRVNNTTYNLDDLRAWIKDVHPDILLSHRIKRIWTGGQHLWTFDWDAVFFKVLNSTLVNDFLNDPLRTNR